MNKKKLLALLAKKEARKAELGTKASTATTVEELRSINAELESLNTEIAEFRSITDGMPDDEEPIAGGSGEQRGAQPPAAGHSPVPPVALASFGLGGQQQQRGIDPDDVFDTLEYRNAFKTYATTGEKTPELLKHKAPDMRANAMTTTSDVAAVIPTTILNEVIQKLSVYGQIFKRIRQMNIPGGVEVPILSLKPIATWIGETPTSDKQKVEAKTKVSFLYYGLECKVSISLLAGTVTLAGFESTITKLIVEAMVKAIDLAVIRGTGIGSPLGIINETKIPAEQIVTMTDAEISAYESWAEKVFATLPLAYQAEAVFIMASGTFEGKINGMVDTTGQPISRVNFGITGGSQKLFGGREVILVENDVIPPFNSAVAGDVIGIYCNLNNYGFNSNLQMQMYRWLDHDTNEWVDKAILIADGKLLDPNGIVLIKKAATI